MTETSPYPGSRASRTLSLAWLAVFTLVLLRRPLAYGASLGDVVLFGAYLALYVIVPGCLAHRMLRSTRDVWLLELGQGWALGLALEAFALIALKVLHADAWFAWYPLAFVPAAAVLWRRRRGGPAPGPEPPLSLVHLVALLAIVALAVQRQRLYPAGACDGQAVDFLFHAGNAAELANNWPLLDPRFAGQALHYHFFSYVFHVGASRMVHVPVRDALGCLGPSAVVALLALQVFNAGRLYGRSAAAGLVAAAVVMFHADVLDEVGRLCGARLGTNSRLDSGIYLSVTTSSGLVFFTTIAIVLHGWLGSRTMHARTAFPLLAVFGAMASGVKGSVMPVVLGGLGALAAFELVFERRFDLRVLGAFAVLALGAVPMTLFLSVGSSSYASAMFHLAPAMVLRQSAFFAAITRLSGVDANAASMFWIALVLPIWIVMYSGIAGVGAILSRRSRAGATNESERWIWSCAAVGLGLAIALGSPGLSQLFFLYNGQVGLALLSGAPIVAAWRVRTARSAALAALLASFAVPLAIGTARDITALARRVAVSDPGEPTTMVALRQALAWVREHVPADAVVVRRQQGIFVSVYGERRAFNETARFTPLALDEEWRSSGGSAQTATEPTALERERVTITESLFAMPDVHTADRLAKIIGRDLPIYLLVDAVREHRKMRNHFVVAELQGEPWPEKPGFLELVFSNAAARIYRLEVARDARGQ